MNVFLQVEVDMRGLLVVASRNLHCQASSEIRGISNTSATEYAQEYGSVGFSLNKITAVHEAVSITCWFACEYNVTAGSPLLERKELALELTCTLWEAAPVGHSLPD